MEAFSTGLSLILGRVLTEWCQQLQPRSLDRYLEIGGFRGLEAARGMTEAEAIAQLRSSGLRDRTLTPEPAYLKWHEFMRDHQPGRLVVDALNYDPRSQAASFLLAGNPYGLVEGLAIAAQVTGARQVVVLLPPEHQGDEVYLLNALEELEHNPSTEGLDLTIEPLPSPAPLPSVYLGDPPLEGEGPCLVHKIDVWYELALVFSLGQARFATLGQQGQPGTCLLTVLGGVNRPGLVEAPLGSSLWQVVETLAGGLKPGASPAGISLDGGLGGFMPVGETGTPLAPEELLQAGVSPVPRTLEVLERDACVVDLTRRALYRYWILSAEEPCPDRTLIARAARMVTEVTRGKARPGHVAELKDLARRMASHRLAAAWPLMSSLAWFEDQWLAHIEKGRCPSDFCLKVRPAPCQATCPANIDIPSFLARIGHGQPKDAVRVISKDNPLPYVCGLVCPAPCEGACLRGEMDEAISIRAMKAVASKESLDKGGYPKPRLARQSGKKVAVVGSGPAGLTCAYYLTLKGHKVTIFEAQDDAGGMLRYGIPAYRLPREVLGAETEMLTRLGIEIKTGVEIDNIQQLRDMGFDASFLALGTQLSRLIPIEGVDLPFVLGGLDFLKDVRGGGNPKVGPRVVVIGGGNVAIDVALSALRQGGHRVDMICLEKRREMPASPHEVDQALAEGVAIHNSWGPLAIKEDKKVRFQQCTRVFDERGRFSPQFNPERIMELEADHVILAIGQATDLACVEQDSLVETLRGLICTDDKTLATNEEGVFAGGDVVHGPRTVVEAVKAGKRAAAAMDAYLHGKPMDERALRPEPKEVVPPLPTPAVQREQIPRAAMSYIGVEDRRGNFQQVELGLDPVQANNESSRCLRCDLCIGCGLCQLVCSEVGAEALRLRDTGADRLAFNDFTRPSTRCIGCGACAQACPTGAIKLRDVDGVRQTVLTGTVVREQELLRCGRCGVPYVTPAYLEHLKKRVGAEAVSHVERGICPACARSQRARELAGAPFTASALA